MSERTVWLNRKSKRSHEVHPDDPQRTLCGADTRDLVKASDGGALGRIAIYHSDECLRCEKAKQ